eukprot:scaffold21143_cov53-Attheya_sp.AAC.3
MMMLSKTLSAASAAILAMLAMIYYYSDDSDLVFVLLFALAVTNEYAMETTVFLMLGFVLLAIIGIYIGSAGSSDEFSVPSGSLGEISTTRTNNYYDECQEEEEEDSSQIYQPSSIPPKKRRKNKPITSFKPRRSPRLMGGKCTRSGRRYG